MKSNFPNLKAAVSLNGLEDLRRRNQFMGHKISFSQFSEVFSHYSQGK